MKYNLHSIPLITFLFVRIFTLNGQPNADFSMNPAAGCSPLIVNFTNQSTDYDSVFWYFGQQLGTSTLENPQFTYINPGVYDVSLVVFKLTEKDSVSKIITVYRNPVADFTSPDQKGCIPHSAQLNDNSTKGDGVIQVWEWDFGTGTLIFIRNPSRVYSQPGKFGVFLKVTDEYGCYASVYKPNFIDAANPPVANFNFSPASSCVLPANFSFANTSSGSGILTYSWNFGDNTTSSLQNPSKTYNSYSNYEVRLTTASDYGCSDDTVKTVYVNEVTAIGTLTQNSEAIQSGDTICSGVVNYNSTSTGTSSVRWIFGDGQSSISKTGFNNYNTSGPVTIRLIAAPGTQCADTVSWNVFIERPQANFTLLPVYSCKTPVTVTFTNQSSGDISWVWDFPDGQSATSENTVHNITLPPDTDPFVIHKDTFIYTSLTVESPHGCTSIASKSIRIKRPTALFTVDIDTGCFPLQVKFTDASISEEDIIAKSWVFGDGGTSSSLTSFVDHAYNSDNIFNSYLIISNSSGCSDTSYIKEIKTGKKLFPDFTVNPGIVCPHETVTFTNTTPESSLIENFYYTINDVGIDTLLHGPNPEWVVIPDTGYMDVKLEVRYNGCISDTVKDKVLYNKGPVSDYSYSVDCSSPFDYDFTNTSRGYTGFKWLISNTENITVSNPSHSFASEGDSVVTLISYKETCSDTAFQTVYIRNVQAVISADSLFCADVPINFDGSLSFTFPNYITDKYKWYFSDTSQAVYTDNDIITNIFGSRGYKNISLVASYDNGCKDSTAHRIRIFEPYTGFEADKIYGCPPLFVEFTDTTKADVHPIENWHWNFELGIDSSYSVQIPTLTHWYNNPGSYSVQLEVTDTFGCIGVQTAVISSGNPDAQFVIDDSTLCISGQINFYSVPQSIDSLIWNFGDGQFSGSLTRPMPYSYQNPGNYTPTLTLYRFGCSDTFALSDGQIEVQDADASFTVSDTLLNCYPLPVTFNYLNTADSGVWNFGFGNNTSDDIGEPQVFYYPLPGTYAPSLRVVTSFGCRDTFERVIDVNGPTGTFSLTDSLACRFEEITFIVNDTNDTYYFEWDFGDGSPFIKADTITHTYTDVGYFYPKLLLWGDPAGTCKPAIVDTIGIFRVIADFEVPDSGLCENAQVLLLNLSEGNDTNYWNFNGTFFSNDEDLQLNLSTGVYYAELIVKSREGCSDTLLQNLTVHPLPVLEIMNDTVICSGDSAILRASGGDQIVWSPGSGLSSTGIYNPVATPDISTLYTALVWNNVSGCQSTGDIYVVVQQAPDLVLTPPLDSIIIGDTFRIAVDSLDDFIYSWSPGTMINCTNCASPLVNPLETTTYSLFVTDTNNCFSETYVVNIPVRKSFIIVLPTAFIPTGEIEENRVIKVRGHGIKNLIEFRVYNRWGNEVFYTDDINQGWDGFYNGKLQSIDSYGYVVKAEMWDGTIQTKNGTFTLLR